MIAVDDIWLIVISLISIWKGSILNIPRVDRQYDNSDGSETRSGVTSYCSSLHIIVNSTSLLHQYRGRQVKTMIHRVLPTGDWRLP